MKKLLLIPLAIIAAGGIYWFGFHNRIERAEYVYSIPDDRCYRIEETATEIRATPADCDDLFNRRVDTRNTDESYRNWPEEDDER